VILGVFLKNVAAQFVVCEGSLMLHLCCPPWFRTCLCMVVHESVTTRTGLVDVQEIPGQAMVKHLENRLGCSELTLQICIYELISKSAIHIPKSSSLLLIHSPVVKPCELQPASRGSVVL